MPFRRAAVRPVPRRHWLNLRCRCPEGAWRFRSPADLAFSLLSCPHPPDPLPLRGRGGLRVILCKGQSPAPHNAIVENTPGFPHRVEKTVDFSPPFSQPVENYVEKHGMHSRMQPPQTANPGIAAEKHAPAVLWICIKTRTDKFRKSTESPTGCPQMPVDRNPGFPTENRKNPSTTTGLSRSERRRTPKNPPKPPPDADFHNPSRQNPDIPHRTAPAKTPKSSCRGWIFRFSTVPRPLLLLLLDGRIEGWTDRARARGRRKAGRR